MAIELAVTGMLLEVGGDRILLPEWTIDFKGEPTP